MNDATLNALRAFPDQLEAHYGLIPATHKHWAPASWEGVPSEALTALEQVCHVRDIEIEGYQRRIERTLAEDNPFLPSIDTDALARDRGYGASNAAEALAAFREARAKTMRVIERFNPADLDRIADFEGYGPVTLRSLIHYLCSHDQQHLAGLQWLLGKIESGSGPKR
jgi:DinB superfamily